MEISIYQIDAFTSSRFTGNPAAVMPLTEWLPDEKLRAIAAENNLSETAFFVHKGEKYELRWFTPKAEVELCGHATLAAAYVIFKESSNYESNQVTFETKYKGDLFVKKEEGYFIMDFPAYEVEKKQAGELADNLEIDVKAAYENPYLILELNSEKEVAALSPDLHLISQMHEVGVAITAPGEAAEIDFVSRFFVPNLGIPEDPATGSLQVALASIWKEKLGRSVLRSRQVSRRGGDFWIDVRDGRVMIKGQAVKVMEGTFYV